MRWQRITRREALHLLAGSAAGAACTHAHAVECFTTGSAVSTRLTLEIGEPHGANVPQVDSNGPTAIDREKQLWFIQAVGGTIASTPWRIYRGPDMDHLVLQNEFVPNAHWQRPHGDDTWWAEGLWIDPVDGSWYVVMHQEYNYNRYQRRPGTGYSIDRMVTVSLARSTDRGRSFVNLGEIIGSDHPEDPGFWADRDFRDGGQGDPSLFIDDRYFYVYYNARWLSRDDLNDIYSGVRVARCPLAARMSPGQWRKFYLGSWGEPGIGGHDSDVFNENYSDTATVFWSASRRCYFGVTLSDLKFDPLSREFDYRGFVATCTDLGRQNWSRSIQLCGRELKGYYTWVMDPETGSRYVMRRDEFNWYGFEFSRTNPNARTRSARIVAAPSNPVVVAPRYPPQSVDDWTPGWDRVRFPNCRS